MSSTSVYSKPLSRTEYLQSADAVEKAFPELWHKCYPRRYVETGHAQYDSPKVTAWAMMDALLSYTKSIVERKQPGQTEQNEALWAATMAKYGVPTYYVGQDMAMALTQTVPGQILNCLEMHLPFNAAAFMLPKDTIVHQELGQIAFVAYVRGARNSTVDCPNPIEGFKHELVSMNASFSIFLRTVEGTMLHWTFSDGMHMIDLKNEEELEELQAKYSHTSSNPGFPQDFTPADIVATTRAIKFIFNVILLMTHKPETVETARLIKRVKQGPTRPIEYWQPHIIGRNYKLHYEHHDGGSGGTHASPRGHWVSGFWREQPHGPQHSLRKTLWIEPFWRGGVIE